MLEKVESSYKAYKVALKEYSNNVNICRGIVKASSDLTLRKSVLSGVNQLNNELPNEYDKSRNTMSSNRGNTLTYPPEEVTELTISKACFLLRSS